MIEIWQLGDQTWDRQSADGCGTMTSNWNVRIHVNGPSWSAADSLARAIALTALIGIRASDYMTVGNESFGELTPTPLGFALDISLSLEHTFSRTDYETVSSIDYTPLIFTVDTTKTSAGSTAADHFKLPLLTGGAYDFQVDWGDGNTDAITVWNDAATDHAYAAPGVYTVSILGVCWGWQFAGTGDTLKPHTLSQWGNGWRFTIGNAGGEQHWEGCANLVVTATDTPDMTDATSLRRSFLACALLTGLGNQAWDLSGVDSISSMFEGATAFNQDLGAWDVGNITNMFTLFNTATNFNNGGSDSIKDWDTSKVYWMYAMFKDTAFNQPIGGWDVSGVYSMAYMFSGSPFNQDIAGWDTSFCADMSYMLRNTPINRDLSGWNVENVANFQNMLNGATAFKQNLGAWWMRSGSSGFANMFNAGDMNLGGSPANIVTNAQEFNNAAWTKTNLTVATNTTAAPDGSTTADSLRPSATNSTDHSVKQTKTVVNGTAYTVRVALRALQLTWGQLICTGAITADVYVNLSTGAIESSNGAVSVTDVGGGWYVLEITGVASTTSLVMRIKAWNNASGTSFAGNASDAIAAWQASMFDGGSLDNYSNFLSDIVGWTGGGDGSATRTGVTAVTVAVGGVGYTVGDVLTVVGGTLGVGSKSAEIKVATIDGAGAVLTTTLHRGSGNYDTQPANAAATTGGTGSGCTLTLTWGTKFAGLPVSKSFSGGSAKYSIKDRLATNARKNLILATGSGGKGWTITDGGPL
jgi:surface protein